MPRFVGFFKKQLLVRIAATFIAVTLLILVVLALLFSRIYLDAVRNNLIIEYERSLHQKLSDLESIDSHANDIFRTAITDTDVTFFLYEGSWSAYDEYRAAGVLGKIKALSTLVHSITLYNASTGWCISTNYTSAPVAEFADPPPVVPSELRKMVVPRTVESADGTPVLVVTFYYFTGREELGPSRGRSVVAIDLIDEFGVSDGVQIAPPFYAFLDEHMDLVSRDITMADSSDVSSLADRIRERPESGSFVATIDDRSVLVTYRKSEDIGWTLVRIDPNQPLQEEIATVRNRIILGAGVAFVVFAGIVLILSRRIYSPVETLMRTIREAHVVADDQSKGELAIILESLTDLSRQITSLEEERTKDIVALRTGFLSRLCAESIPQDEYQKSRQRLRLALGDEDISVVIVSGGSFASIERERRQVLLSSITRVLSDTLAGISAVEVFATREHQICAMLSETHALPTGDLRARLTSAVRSGKELLGLELAIGIGQTVESPGNIRESYSDAVGIVDHHLTTGGGWVHDRKSLNAVVKERIDYPSATEHALVTAFRTGAADDFSNELDSMVSLLENRPFADATMALTRISMILGEVSGDLLSQVGHDALAETRGMNMRLSHLDSLCEWREWMMFLFKQSHELIGEATDGKRESEIRILVAETVQYIEENHSDPGLYGESVAAHFAYSPSYFAKIFRDATGRSIADHLREFRIERAKELLAEDSNITVKQVAAAVGYANINYFYQVFKKTVGVTPAVFKDLPTRKR